CRGRGARRGGRPRRAGRRRRRRGGRRRRGLGLAGVVAARARTDVDAATRAALRRRLLRALRSLLVVVAFALLLACGQAAADLPGRRRSGLAGVGQAGPGAKVDALARPHRDGGAIRLAVPVVARHTAAGARWRAVALIVPFVRRQPGGQLRRAVRTHYRHHLPAGIDTEKLVVSAREDAEAGVACAVPVGRQRPDRDVPDRDR